MYIYIYIHRYDISHCVDGIGLLLLILVAFFQYNIKLEKKMEFEKEEYDKNAHPSIPYFNSPISINNTHSLSLNISTRINKMRNRIGQYISNSISYSQLSNININNAHNSIIVRDNADITNASDSTNPIDIEQIPVSNQIQSTVLQTPVHMDGNVNAAIPSIHHQYVYNDQVNMQRNRRSPSSGTLKTTGNVQNDSLATLAGYWQAFNAVFDSTNNRENEAYIPLVATHTHSK